MFFASKKQPRRSRSRVRSRSRNRNQPKEQTVKIEETVDEEEPKNETLQLSFNCQLAQGSETVKVSNFGSVVELFEQISKGFGIGRDDIIFCTLNTVKMDGLFSGTMVPDDLLFVHVRGQPVELELTKTEETLGVTIADNGLCRSFIKRIRQDSVAGAAKPALDVGQLIESVQGRSVLGLRHYEVAKIIRSIPVGQTFTLRLISPKTSGFNMLQPRSRLVPASASKPSTGMGTIRFKADGGVVVQTDGPNRELIDKMNTLFRNYLGVEDDELAQTIWDTAVGCSSLQEMFQKVRNSELQMFEFPDELVYDMWGIVTDLGARKIND